jgi:hypothetical protein
MSLISTIMYYSVRIDKRRRSCVGCLTGGNGRLRSGDVGEWRALGGAEGSIGRTFNVSFSLSIELDCLPGVEQVGLGIKDKRN